MTRKGTASRFPRSAKTRRFPIGQNLLDPLACRSHTPWSSWRHSNRPLQCRASCQLSTRHSCAATYPSSRRAASAGLLADNFLDMAHFPFIHAQTFGAGEAREVPKYTVTRNGLQFEASYEHEFSNREDPGVAAGLRPLLQRRRLTYRYTAPFHLELAIEFLDAGGTNVIGFFLTPLDDERVRIYSSLWRNDLDGSQERMAEAIDFEVAVVNEDSISSHATRCSNCRSTSPLNSTPAPTRPPSSYGASSATSSRQVSKE